MKKRTKIISIVLASVLAVSAVGVGTTAVLAKNNSSGSSSVWVYDKDSGEYVERANPTDMDEIIAMSMEARKNATDPSAKTEKLYESKIKPMLINYFDSIGIDVKDRVNSLEIKIAELPASYMGCYISGNIIYLNDLLWTDTFSQCDPGLTKKDCIIHTMIHESIHALGYCTIEETETSAIEEAITEYLTGEVYEFNDMSTDNLDSLSAYYDITDFVKQVLMISPTFIQDHYEKGYNYLDEFFGEYKASIEEAMTNYWTAPYDTKCAKAYKAVVDDYIENTYTGDEDIYAWDIVA